MRRVPVLIVIPLAVAAVALPWWYWTRQMDFMTPPAESELVRIRQETLEAVGVPEKNRPATEEDLEDHEVQLPIKPPPQIDPGDPQAPAELDEYAEVTREKGAGALVELATRLEELGGNARALLAWERVLDTAADPEPEAVSAALSGVKRLRPLVPPWSADPLDVRTLVLEAVVDRHVAESALEPELGAVAERAGAEASGLVKFLSKVVMPEAPKPVRRPARGRNRAAAAAEAPAAPEGPPMVSLQLMAEGEGAASTGVIELPLSDDPAVLRRDLLAGIYRLIASQVAAATELAPPVPLADDGDPAEALGSHLTRWQWAEFGKSLQPPEAE